MHALKAAARAAAAGIFDLSRGQMSVGQELVGAERRKRMRKQWILRSTQDCRSIPTVSEDFNTQKSVELDRASTQISIDARIRAMINSRVPSRTRIRMISQS